MLLAHKRVRTDKVATSAGLTSTHLWCCSYYLCLGEDGCTNEDLWQVLQGSCQPGLQHLACEDKALSHAQLTPSHTLDVATIRPLSV